MAHVSYSEIKTWNECPHKHKLQYVDKIAGFKGNLHTAFGTAIHSVCEHGLLNEDLDREKHFLEEFEKEIENNVEQLIEKFGKIDGLVNNAANNPKVEDSESINFSRLEFL